MLGSAKAASASTKCMPVARAAMAEESLGSTNMMMEIGSANTGSYKLNRNVERETRGVKGSAKKMEMKAKASEPVLRVLEDSASDEGEQEIRSMAK